MIIHPGDRHPISTNSFTGKGIVIEIHGVQSAEQPGLLVTYDIDGYGTANEFFIAAEGMNKYRIEERKCRSGMPFEYLDRTAKSFDWSLYGEDVRMQKKIANAFVSQFESFRREGRGLYIQSKTKGSGKTLLACCITNEILKHFDIFVKFISVTDYIELVKDKTEEGKERRDALLNADLLVLDDIGAQVENKEWITNSLFHLVNHRYTRRLVTIYTSNIPFDSMQTDDRISSRIYEKSTPLVMPEVSIRKIKADLKTKEFMSEIMSKEDEE